MRKTGENDLREDRPNLFYYFHFNQSTGDFFPTRERKTKEGYVCIFPQREDLKEGNWRWGFETAKNNINALIPKFMPNRKVWGVMEMDYFHDRDLVKPTSSWTFKDVNSERGTEELINLGFDKSVFPKPKPLGTVKRTLQLATNKDAIILDFFAGSGTTGHAVMQLNAEDGGNRKFILCQIDEQIKEDKPAYQFCIENGLPPVISSITIERLKRAGERLNHDFNKNTDDKQNLFKQNNLGNPENQAKNQGNPENLKKLGNNLANSENLGKNHGLDIGFKVFDSVEAPKLQLDETSLQISILENGIDALSRIYNMIFTIGLDEPTQAPEMVVQDCIYKIGANYYVTNSEKISKEDFANAIKNGKVFIDGWTASLNGTLQNFKEDVKIVF